MRIALITLCLVALSAGFATGQWWGDNFDRNTLTGWTLDKGTWTATNMEAHSQTATIWQYATRPDHVYQNCSVECDVRHPGTGLIFGGVALRVNDPTGGTLGQDLVMAKLQGSSGITQLWLYSFDAAGVRQASSVSSTSALTGKVRLTAIGSRILAEWDSTGDGNYDKSIAQTTTFAVKAGPVGLNGYNGGICDNFAVYNAAILPATIGPKPTPGNTVLYEVGGLPNDFFQGAISLGQGPLPLSATQAIPLTPDGIFFASASNLLGPLNGSLDAAGTGQMGVAIPNIPALVGVVYFTAIVTYDNTGLTGISNEQKTTIS